MKPIAICVAEIDSVFEWSARVPVERKVLEDLLPGPVTVLLERSPNLNADFNPGASLVGE